MQLKTTNKQKLLNNIQQRRIANQYHYMKEWKNGNLTGIEAIELIVAEEHIVRMEEDLMDIEKEKKKSKENPPKDKK